MAFKQRKGRTKKIKGGISFKERVSVRTEIKLRKFHCSFSQIQQRKNSQKPQKKKKYIYIYPNVIFRNKEKTKTKKKKKRINEKLSSYKNRVLWILCNYWNINFSFFLFPSDSRILVSQKTKKKNKKNKNPSKRNFQTTNNKEETKKKKRKKLSRKRIRKKRNWIKLN